MEGEDVQSKSDSITNTCVHGVGLECESAVRTNEDIPGGLGRDSSSSAKESGYCRQMHDEIDEYFIKEESPAQRWLAVERVRKTG